MSTSSSLLNSRKHQLHLTTPFPWTVTHLFHRATEGYGYAKKCLGYWYSFREDLKEEIEERVEEFLYQVELGDPRAILCQGWCYQYGIGLSKDPKKALDCYILANQLDASLSEAYRLIGLTYLDGGINNPLGVAAITKQAIQFFQKAMEVGSGDGDENNGINMISFGYCYAAGIVGVPISQEWAVHWYTEASKKGNCVAYNNLSVHYRDDEGVSQDFYRAFDYLNKAAKLGNADALYSLGRCYDIGEGCRQDKTLSIHYYKQAAIMGDDLAIDRLRYLGILQ